jgi:kumamolisin
VISAAGDAGAYDINRGAAFVYPSCTTLLSVDYPAADPLVLAAGGTTVPNTSAHRYGNVTVSAERPWGWDYLKTYITTYYGINLYYSEYLTVGGGGGVSVEFPLPAYQAGLAGTAKSAGGQSLFCGPAVTGAGFQDLQDSPANYAGRNLPDVSLNADPYSGYLLLFKGGFVAQEGGTSFVAPQLNGIFTLISQGIPATAANPKGRMGMPATQLYSAFRKQGYGAGSPFKAITTGDNEYWKATASFNPASGLGSLDVDALATTLGASLKAAN